MKQEDKLKILLPSLREKERYIAFRVLSDERISYSDLEAAIWNVLLDFYGEYGVSKLSVWLIKNLYDEQNQIGIIKCNNKAIAPVIAGLGLINRLGDTRVVFKILSISGTIKGLKWQ